MNNPEHFCIEGEEHQRVPLHYRESGLDNIFLLNGFIREDIDGEEYITVENVDGLWKAIGLHLVEKRKTLSPKEIKFLRTHMDMTQADLARVLRVTDQTVARWEKGEVVMPGPADFALRTTFLLSEAAQPEGRKVVDELIRLLTDLAESDETASEQMTFRREHNSWLEEELEAA